MGFEETKKHLVEYGVSENEIDQKYEEFKKEAREELGVEAPQEKVDERALRKLVLYYRRIVESYANSEDIEGVILGIMRVSDMNEIARNISEREGSPGVYPSNWGDRAGQPIPDSADWNATLIVIDHNGGLNKLSLRGEEAKEIIGNEEKYLNHRFKARGTLTSRKDGMYWNVLKGTFKVLEETDLSAWDKVELTDIDDIINSVPIDSRVDVAFRGDVERVSYNENKKRWTIRVIKPLSMNLNESIVVFSPVPIKEGEFDVRILGQASRNEDTVFVSLYGTDKIAKKADEEKVVDIEI